MNPGLIIGYHGCSRSTAERILVGVERHLHLSNSAHEWLGRGIYCWENSYRRALEWARQHIDAEEEPAVLGILISPGECLDLTDSKHLATGKSPPVNKGLRHDYDCALFNYFHSYRSAAGEKTLDTIRAAFSEGERIAGGKCTFTRRQHIQWAVINPEQSIVGYFRPAEGLYNPEA